LIFQEIRGRVRAIPDRAAQPNRPSSLLLACFADVHPSPIRSRGRVFAGASAADATGKRVRDLPITLDKVMERKFPAMVAGRKTALR
jgi:hypothetical protein